MKINMLNLHIESVSAYGVRILIWFFALIAPLHDTMGAVLLLIIIDFITGVGAARKNKLAIRSKKMRNTVNKFLFYTLTILAAHIVEEKITSVLPWLELVSGFIALTELRSIFENFNIIFGFNIWDYIKKILKQAKAGSDILDSINDEKKKQEDD